MFEYGKLISEVHDNGVTRLFFHSKGSHEMITARDFLEAMNTLGIEGWECICVDQLRRVDDLDEFPGITGLREAFFKRIKN